jgi:hypothetical protein
MELDIVPLFSALVGSRNLQKSTRPLPSEVVRKPGRTPIAPPPPRGTTPLQPHSRELPYPDLNVPCRSPQSPPTRTDPGTRRHRLLREFGYSPRGPRLAPSPERTIRLVSSRPGDGRTASTRVNPRPWMDRLDMGRCGGDRHRGRFTLNGSHVRSSFFPQAREHAAPALAAGTTETDCFE